MLNKTTVTISIKLFIITAVAALCLAFVNTVTAPIILENSQKNDVKAQKEVLPEATAFKKGDFSENDTPIAAENGVRIESFNVGLADNYGVGYVVTVVSSLGYGGDIRVMIGLDNNLCVTKAKILQSSETAGLGANASKPKFIDQYIGKTNPIYVVKNAVPGDDEVLAISGATITSKAVTSCVNAAVELVSSKLEQGFTADTAAAVNEKLEETKKATDIQINADSTNAEGEVE